MRTLTFRGKKTYHNYFEGWYFKFVDAKQDLIIILIPGISHFKKEMAFLQYIIHYKGKTESGISEYSFKEFQIKNPFRLTFPHGYITGKEVRLSFPKINLHLRLGIFTPIKTSLFSPSIMGFFEYLKMPCYHDIVSLSHKVNGVVHLNENTISFNGKGYIEGDRGSNFPDYYLWAQCNHFSAEKDSLFLSVADIHTPFFHFLGHIAIFYHKGKEYRFASYLGSKVSVQMDQGNTKARILFQNRKHRLQISLRIIGGNTLLAPMNNRMEVKIKEQVKAKVLIRFDNHIDESEFCACELVNWKQ